MMLFTVGLLAGCTTVGKSTIGTNGQRNASAPRVSPAVSPVTGDTEPTRAKVELEIVDPERCPSGGKFTCGPVTRGMEGGPDDPAPIVCGCAPTKCPAGQSMVSSASTERWPDGTYKGSYGCSSTLPPSAPPAAEY